MRWLLWCFCLLAESYETINHYHYCTTMRGSDILRYVIVSGYVAFCQIKVFRQLIFHYLQNVFAGRIYPTGRSLETPDIEE